MQRFNNLFLFLLFTVALMCCFSIVHAQQNWQILNDSPQNGQKQDDVFFINPDLGWAVNGSGKVFNTTNGGENWAQQIHKPGSYFRCVGFANEQKGFLGNIGPDYFPGVTDTNPLYKTEDGGQNWEVIPASQIDGPVPTGLCAIQVIDEEHIVAAGRVGGPAVWIHSSDGGETWQSASLQGHIQMITDIYFESPEVGYIFGGTSNNIQLSRARIIRTNDGGATWSTVFTSARTFELCWKAAFPTLETGYATLLNYAPNYPERYLAKSTDGGLNWEELSFVSNGQKAFGIGFLDANVGWVGTDAGGYETQDGGASWTAKNIGNYVNKIRMIPSDNGSTVGYAIGQRIYKMTTEVVTDVAESEIQNGLNTNIFPNPAKKLINIQFEIPDRQQVEIALYDANGRKLDHIFSGQLTAGEHTQVYNFPNDIMPGIVQVIIQTADHIQVKMLSILP